jgi:hypothetical protein
MSASDGTDACAEANEEKPLSASSLMILAMAERVENAGRPARMNAESTGLRHSVTISCMLRATHTATPTTAHKPAHISQRTQ